MLNRTQYDLVNETHDLLAKLRLPAGVAWLINQALADLDYNQLVTVADSVGIDLDLEIQAISLMPEGQAWIEIKDLARRLVGYTDNQVGAFTTYLSQTQDGMEVYTTHTANFPTIDTGVKQFVQLNSRKDLLAYLEAYGV